MRPKPDGLDIDRGAPEEDLRACPPLRPSHHRRRYVYRDSPDIQEHSSPFWTRLVVWVGRSDPTPLLRVRQYLELSRKHNLEVNILQRPQESESVQEKAQVRDQVGAVMELLAPHMERWSLLRILLKE